MFGKLLRGHDGKLPETKRPVRTAGGKLDVVGMKADASYGPLMGAQESRCGAIERAVKPQFAQSVSQGDLLVITAKGGRRQRSISAGQRSGRLEIGKRPE